MPALDSTVGGAAANSYCSLADADTYHGQHLYASVWTAASDAQQTIALQMATRGLDTMIAWFGGVVSESQALLWPRYDVEGRNGLLIPSDEIPTEVKSATAEYARQLLASNVTADSAVEVNGVTSLTVGPIALTFANVVGKPIPDAVFFLVSHLGTLRRRGGAGSVPLGRS